MVSKMDLIVGVLVLVAGIIIYQFAPGGVLFQKPPDHATTHYVGTVLAIVFGIVGLAMYKKVSTVTLAVSVLSVIVGVVFALHAPGGVLYSALGPHAQAMQGIGGLTALVGLVGIVAAVALKPKK